MFCTGNSSLIFLVKYLCPQTFLLPALSSFYHNQIVNCFSRFVSITDIQQPSSIVTFFGTLSGVYFFNFPQLLLSFLSLCPHPPPLSLNPLWYRLGHLQYLSNHQFFSVLIALFRPSSFLPGAECPSSCSFEALPSCQGNFLN